MIPEPPLAPSFLDPTRDQLVASSAGWLAASLNLSCPGVGYVYQRRWRAFWLGFLAASAAVVVGAGSGVLVANGAMGGRLQSQEESPEILVSAAIGGVCTGLLAVQIVTAVEAGLAVKRARRRLGR